MELIDKKTLLRSLVDWQMSNFVKVGHEREYNLLDSIIKGIENVPTVEAKEVVHGKWIGNTCSACCLNWDENMVNNADDWGYFEPMPNFCPNCGADMRKKV